MTLKQIAQARKERVVAWLETKPSYLIVRDTVKEWIDDKAPRLGAALSFYAITSIAPLLVIAITVAGLVFGEEAARGEIVDLLGGVLGAESAGVLQDMIASAGERASGGIVASVIGTVILLLAASGVFGSLKNFMDVVWEVEPKKVKGVKGFLKERGLLFLVVLAVGVVLLLTLAAGAAIPLAQAYLGGEFPGSVLLWRAVHLAVMFALGTLLFAILYKMLPDANVGWRDLWIGSAATAALFAVGQLGLSVYLSRSATASVYGSAGAVIVMLLWIYYSSLVFFLGAEFTQVYANRRGKPVTPEPGAGAKEDESPSHPSRPSEPGEGRGRPRRTG